MRLIPICALLAIAAPALAQSKDNYDPSLDRMRYDGCVRALQSDAKKAEQFAIEWQGLGGGLPARHCEALAQLQQQRFAAAANTLAKAAAEAESQKSPLVADFWAQAGNAAFLAGDSRGAIAHLDKALAAAGEFAPQRSANILIDRARANAELGDLPAARGDLDKALGLNRMDATAWMLSAAISRRENNIGRASVEISRASALEPSNPDIMFEQGNIAAANGDMESARTVWQRTTKAAPGSEAAALAAKALADSR